MENAQDLFKRGQSVILCKGRRGGKRRLMVMHRATKELLKVWMDERQRLVKKYGCDPGGLILSESEAKHIRTGSKGVQKKFKQVSEAAEIYFRGHDSRASFGHRHYEAGTDLVTIAALMGHESPDQTFRAYIEVNLTDLRKAQDHIG